MKKFIILAVASCFISACATYAPVSYQEKCALKGMVLSGVGSESGSSFAVGRNGAWASGRSQSETVMCRVPETPKEQCEINSYVKAFEPKAKYNDSVSSVNPWIGVGYFIYILPGVVGKLAMDNKLDKAVNSYEESLPGYLSECNSTSQVGQK